MAPLIVIKIALFALPTGESLVWPTDRTNNALVTALNDHSNFVNGFIIAFCYFQRSVLKSDLTVKLL
jgi:hypothetical protein